MATLKQLKKVSSDRGFTLDIERGWRCVEVKVKQNGAVLFTDRGFEVPKVYDDIIQRIYFISCGVGHAGGPWSAKIVSK